jgi:hypothetical protein
MSKPVNKFSLALWAGAIIFPLIELWIIYYGALHPEPLSGIQAPSPLGALALTWRYIPRDAVLGLQLAALGVIIELVDQIRWNAMRRDKRPENSN